MSHGRCTLDQYSLAADLGSDALREALLKAHSLETENQCLKAEMRHREEVAYLHGLGAHAEVHRQNQILAATVAALVDPHHPLLVVKRKDPQ